MRKFIFFLLFLLISLEGFNQNISLRQGIGFTDLKIGDTYEEVQEVLGFGKKKTYEKYLADELFDREPDETLECVLGFDYYIKLEHLITLPVLYVYFRNDKVVQIKTTSFPEYYHPICEDVVIDNGLKFWTNVENIKSMLGKEDVFLDEDYLILETFVYLSKGVSFSARDRQIRIVHIFNPLSNEEKERIIGELLN